MEHFGLFIKLILCRKRQEKNFEKAFLPTPTDVSQALPCRPKSDENNFWKIDFGVKKLWRYWLLAVPKGNNQNLVIFTERSRASRAARLTSDRRSRCLTVLSLILIGIGLGEMTGLVGIFLFSKRIWIRDNEVLPTFRLNISYFDVMDIFKRLNATAKWLLYSKMCLKYTQI